MQDNVATFLMNETGLPYESGDDESLNSCIAFITLMSRIFKPITGTRRTLAFGLSGIMSLSPTNRMKKN